MAIFLKHVACDRCGSSDAKGIYDDGSSFCFSCRSSSRGTRPPMVSEAGHSDTVVGHRPLPADCNTHFGPSAVDWLAQYGVDIPTAIGRDVLWSESRQQLIFTWKDQDNETLLWQARNFQQEYIKDGMVRKVPKCFTSGDHSDILPIYSNRLLGFNSDVLVITEDPLSALKVVSSFPSDNAPRRPLKGPTVDAMPLLGSHLPDKKLLRLRGYNGVVVWLDHDKGNEALSIAGRIRLLGIWTKVVLSDLDPKCYSHEEVAYHIGSVSRYNEVVVLGTP